MLAVSYRFASVRYENAALRIDKLANNFKTHRLKINSKKKHKND